MDTVSITFLVGHLLAVVQQTETQTVCAEYEAAGKVIRAGPADGTWGGETVILIHSGNHILTEQRGDRICQREVTRLRSRYDLWCTYKTTTTHTFQN